MKNKRLLLAQRGGIELVIILLVVLVSSVIVGGLGYKKTTPTNNQAVNIVEEKSSGNDNSLQLKALDAKPQSVDCPHDNGQAINNGKPYDPNSSCKCPQYIIECKDKKCYKVYKDMGSGSTCNSTYDSWCLLSQLAPTDGIYCLGKPVIYLYPTKDTFVNVSVDTSGKIVESIPEYPLSGWQNILAHPNGNLEYNGKSYNELYYESSVGNIKAPKEGMTVKIEDVKKTLIDLTGKLGLIANEQNELINYWLPKIKALNSPYVFISVVDNSEKQKVDKINIYPKPDTMIEFLLYFKPEYSKFEPKPLILPEAPPKRTGFTAVEWGGTIDNN